jgi:hypothetical protein
LFFPGNSGRAFCHDTDFTIVLVTQLDALVVEMFFGLTGIAYKILWQYHGNRSAGAKKRVAFQAESHP